MLTLPLTIIVEDDNAHYDKILAELGNVFAVLPNSIAIAEEKPLSDDLYSASLIRCQDGNSALTLFGSPGVFKNVSEVLIFMDYELGLDQPNGSEIVKQLLKALDNLANVGQGIPQLRIVLDSSIPDFNKEMKDLINAWLDEPGKANLRGNIQIMALPKSQFEKDRFLEKLHKFIGVECFQANRAQTPHDDNVVKGGYSISFFSAHMARLSVEEMSTCTATPRSSIGSVSSDCTTPSPPPYHEDRNLERGFFKLG